MLNHAAQRSNTQQYYVTITENVSRNSISLVFGCMT